MSTKCSAEEIGADEIVVEVLSDPDGQGRRLFVAYWRDNYLPRDGVRGQVFRTQLDRFAAEAERAHRTVRRRNERGPVTA